MRAATTAFLAAVACGAAEPASPHRPAAAPAPAAEPAPAEPAGKEVRLATMGDPDGSAGLTAEQIHSVVRARKADINACYEVELAQHSALRGKLVVSWSIAADGTAQDVTLRSTTLENATVASCVLRQVSQLVFPAPVGGKRVNVNFPFLFQPRGD